MKCTTRILTALAGLMLACALALPVLTQAQEVKRGAEKLMQLKPIQTVADIQALEPGDMLTMSCPKCKNVTVTYVEKTTKRADATEKTTLKHLCPGCETTFKVEGHGKAKKDVLVHVCKECGSKEAFCCVMKKGSGPTKGMEEKK